MQTHVKERRSKHAQNWLKKKSLGYSQKMKPKTPLTKKEELKAHGLRQSIQSIQGNCSQEFPKPTKEIDTQT